MHDAIAACWSTLAAFNAAYDRDSSGNGETPDVIATDDAFHAAWRAALATVPTTVAGAAALAKCGLDLARVRQVDEYHEQAVQALARLAT